MSKSGNLAALAPILNPSDVPTIFYAEDPPYLPRILIFYWPVQAVGSLASTSRIRTTILSAAGFKSFGAFSVAPSSSYYSAVHKLPEEKQRDEVCRGVAFALCRYFSEVPTEVKNAIADDNVEHGISIKWGQSHAAQVACRMSKVTNSQEIIDALRPFSKERLSSPTATPIKSFPSIRKTRPSYLPAEPSTHGPSRLGQMSTPSRRIPSFQQRRTPSSSTSNGKKTLALSPQKPNMEQLESLRFKMCEFVDTEDRYITRLQELIDLVTHQTRTPKSLSSKFSEKHNRGQKAMHAMLHFPALLDQIKELNLAFLDDIESCLRSSEDAALQFLDQSLPNPDTPQKDAIGIYAFAKVLLNHFPKFPMPYREYLDLHSQISSNLDQYLKEGTTSIQQAPSLLMEPAQRISRYGLYIDTMIPSLPPTATLALRTLEKARKIIAEICEMEPAASTILDSLHIEYEAKRRTLSPSKILSGLTRSNGTIREAPALTGSLREREIPRLLPSLSRSFSRKNRSRPGLASILSEKDPEQASNMQRGEENRPHTSSSNPSSSPLSKSRPATAGSTDGGGVGLVAGFLGGGTAASDKYRLQVVKLEEENYRLLQENAELKRRARECKCGGARRVV